MKKMIIVIDHIHIHKTLETPMLIEVLTTQDMMIVPPMTGGKITDLPQTSIKHFTLSSYISAV